MYVCMYVCNYVCLYVCMYGFWIEISVSLAASEYL